MTVATESPLSRFLERYATRIVVVLIALAIADRVLLALLSPVPFGYVYDLYHRGVVHLYETGRLPEAKDCFVCAHPPLFFLAGWPFYALGMALRPGDPAFALRVLGVLPALCGLITCVYAYRLLAAMRFERAQRVLGTALVVTFPCLALSGAGTEADVLLTACMAAFLFHLMRYFLSARRAGAFAALRLGALAGLALLTKYSGAVALVAGVAVLALCAKRDGWRASARDAAIFVATLLALSGWKLADNVAQHGTPFASNGMAQDGFAMTDKTFHWEIYDFTSFRFHDALALWAPDEPRGALTRQPVYYSVWTTLHTMAWTDMSMFSVSDRHGLRSHPYPGKPIRRWLLGAMLVLGTVPSCLALLGFVVTFRRRLTWPLSLYGAVGLFAYVWWFAAQMTWSLKTKYILFLLPPYVCYVLFGTQAIRRVARLPGDVVLALLFALVVISHLYLFEFAAA